MESSANKQTGTYSLRQAPGRARDGQRKSGGGVGGVEAMHGEDEKDTIKEMEGGNNKTDMTVHRSEGNFCNLFL